MKAYFKTTLITAIIAAFVYAGVSLALLGLSVRQALSAKSQAAALAQGLTSLDLAVIQQAVAALEPKLSKANTYARFSFWLSAVPLVRQPYLAYRETTRAGASAVEALRQLPINSQEPSAAIQALFSAYPQLSLALSDFESALARVSRISPALIPESQQKEWQEALSAAGNIQALFEQIKPLWQRLPIMLGQDEPFDLLVLLQNNHELRPTGGFIGTYARITIERGAITTFYTDDVYNLDVAPVAALNRVPPQPLQQYLGSTIWYFWDSNWSPDFPTSAHSIIDLYKLASGEGDIDAVVALTPAIVEDFLRLTGPITVDGLTFTAENLIDVLEYRVEQEFWRIGLRDDERKKIINDLAQAIKQRFFALQGDQAVTMAHDARRLLDNGEILLYSDDAALQRLVTVHGWAGEIRSTAGDYLFVVDSNLGALKTDRLVDRDYSYEVREQDDGSWVATLRLHYRNRGHFDYRTTRYRTYTRVYTPLGSELLAASGFMTADRSTATAQPSSYAETGKQVFAGFVSVEPGQERTASVSYRLPPWLAREITEGNRYTLLWQKQPGAVPDTQFVIESRENLFSFAPSELSYKLENPKTLRAQAVLDADRTYTVRFAP